MDVMNYEGLWAKIRKDKWSMLALEKHVFSALRAQDGSYLGKWLKNPNIKEDDKVHLRKQHQTDDETEWAPFKKPRLGTNYEFEMEIGWDWRWNESNLIT